jgi:type IV pilus assembly protein PilA
MFQRVQKHVKNQRGVTLIELLAVIVILGIIAAIAAPAVISNFDDAKKNSDEQTEKIVRDAAKRYILDIRKSGGDPDTTNISVLVDDYLDSVPKWSNNASVTLTISDDGKTIIIGNKPSY